MEIVFVRHAEKESGKGDFGLSKKGVEQAKNLAERLSNYHLDEIYCSNLKRTIETAKILSQKLNIPINIEPSLNEFESDVLKLKKEKWTKENKIQYSNLRSFLKKITKNAEEEKKILIIAHGNTNRLILAILLELNLKNIIRFRLLETGISEVYWVSKFKNWRLKYWNDVSHQPKELVEGDDKY